MAQHDQATAPRSWHARLRVGWQVKWVVTVAGAVAMTIIAGILAWNVITAPHPLAQLVPGFTRTVERHATGEQVR